MEYNLNERLPQREKTSMEDDILIIQSVQIPSIRKHILLKTTLRGVRLLYYATLSVIVCVFVGLYSVIFLQH